MDPGHSLANAHRNAGDIANASGYDKCTNTTVGRGTSQTEASNMANGGICPRKPGSMSRGASVALKRKKPPSNQVRRSRRPANNSRAAPALYPASRIAV